MTFRTELVSHFAAGFALHAKARMSLLRFPHVLVCWLLAAAGGVAGETAELVLQRGSEVEVQAAVYSPDGRIVASAGESRTIRLWDRESGEVVRMLPGHAERVAGLAFSPDGKWLASSSTDGSVKVWDVREGKLAHHFTKHVGNWARRVAFSPDSRKLTAATYKDGVSVWDVTSGTVLLTLPITGRVRDILFTPDGKSVVTACSYDGSRIQFWDAATGARGLTLNHPDESNSIAISRDGRLLASSENSRQVRLWEFPSGRELRTLLPLKDESVLDVDISPDGRWLAMTGRWVGSIWDVSSGALRCELRGHEDGMVQISFSPDGTEVATGSADATVRLWNPRSGELRRILPARPPDTPITSLAFSANGEFEAMGCVDGSVRVWSARDGSFRYDLRGHEGPVLALGFTPDHAWLLSGSADRTMRVWDMAHGTVSAYQPYFNRTDVIGALACGRGNEIATAVGRWGGASLDHSIRVFKTHFDRVVRELKGHAASVRTIASAPGTDLLASASEDGVVKLWDPKKGACLQTSSGEVPAEALAFSADSRTLAAGMADGTVRVLEAESLAVAREWAAHRRPVQALALSTDGRWLATASTDGTVAVWEWATGREVRRFENVTSQYLPLAFHPQKPVLAFAQRDEMVVHANVETGEILFQRVLFPDREWLAWNPAKAIYMASPLGDEHARVRFAGQLVPVYPLTFYRKELRRERDLLAALGDPAPVLAPKNFQLWWQRFPNKAAWAYALSALFGAWVALRLRRGWIDARRRRTQEAFSRQLLLSQEAERKRIAAELHDGLGQQLLIIKNRLYLAQEQVNGNGQAAELEEISQTVSQTIAEVREISHNLRPYQLDRLGLTKAVRATLKKIADSGSLRIESEIGDIDGLFSPEGEINFYRIVQESLNNILKHSAAATARIRIERTDGRLTMRIEDDGRGFDSRRSTENAASARGFGLTGLGERARILGGRFDCASAPGHGTRLTFDIPLPTQHERPN